MLQMICSVLDEVADSMPTLSRYSSRPSVPLMMPWLGVVASRSSSQICKMSPLIIMNGFAIYCKNNEYYSILIYNFQYVHVFNNIFP